eukprot:Ihof_evm5s263 gene=Ihof_evmTU5s263
MVLSGKQQEELHKAIFDYLITNKFNETAKVFQEESMVDDLDDITLKRIAGLLEKKWVSVVRLQKKVMDLEQRVGQLTEEVSQGATRKPDNKNWIPRPPERYMMRGHREPITCVRFHPVFSLCVSTSEDATIKIWDFETGEFERTLKGHTNIVQDVAFDHSGNLMASCSADLTVKLWDFQTYECIKTLHGHDHNVSGVVFLPSGDHILSASRDKTIKMWEVATGYCIRTFKGHSDWVRSVAVNLDGSLFASCSNDKEARVWSPGSTDCKMVLRGHEHVIECVAFANHEALPFIGELMAGDKKSKTVPTGDFVATGSRDKTIKIWELSTGRCLNTLTGHDNWVRTLRFHPRGKLLLSGGDDK